MISDLIHFVVAYALALPLGIQRERKNENHPSPGLRTFPLVASASCAFVLVGRAAFADDTEAMGRVLYGLVTGIGFIGGGAILKNRDSVRGTSTAAALWATGAIGAAVGFGIFHLAALTSLVTGATLYFAPRWKKNDKL